MALLPDTATVLAARDGDPIAVERLVAGYLPLVYAIVGRALDGHADVDDVVQDTMLRVLRGITDLRDPEAFRSWLVAITVRRVREHCRTRQGVAGELLPEDVRDPGADFADLAILRHELQGQRRETAEATRWLDEDDRELLSLWWLEASGELTRDEIVGALDVTRQHAAVRIQRMKGQLDTARVVVRALSTTPRCVDLVALTAGWDGRPGSLWRKRIARHARDCAGCSTAWSGLVAAEGLLVGMGLVPVPFALSALSRALAHAGSASAGGTAAAAAPAVHTSALGAVRSVAHGAARSTTAGSAKAAAIGGAGIGRGALTAVLVTVVVAGGGVAVALDQRADAPVMHAAAPSATSSAPATVTPSPAPSPSATQIPSPEADPAEGTPLPPSAPTEEPVAVPVVAASAKKGVSTWAFDGVEGALDDVGASWYYTWSSSDQGLSGPADVEFVPMIWGAGDVTGATLTEVAGEGAALLGFNEPDMAGQANMTVEEALAAWPRLEDTGLRLGSPAVAYGGDTPGGWLDRFMSGAEQQGLRVDFIALHWYGSDFSAAAVDQFLGYVDAVHARYGLPIWVTEYGLMNFAGSPRYPTGAQAAAFIAGSTAGMESRDHVERYAWFGLPAVGDSVDFGLYTDATTPTEAGAAYRAAG